MEAWAWASLVSSTWAAHRARGVLKFPFAGVRHPLKCFQHQETHTIVFTPESEALKTAGPYYVYSFFACFIFGTI